MDQMQLVEIGDGVANFRIRFGALLAKILNTLLTGNRLARAFSGA